MITMTFTEPYTQLFGVSVGLYSECTRFEFGQDYRLFQINVHVVS
jgi:hypothetical protein